MKGQKQISRTYSVMKLLWISFLKNQDIRKGCFSPCFATSASGNTTLPWMSSEMLESCLVPSFPLFSFLFLSPPLNWFQSYIHFTPHPSPLHSKYCRTFRPPSLADYTVKENTNWYHYLFFHISISPISSVVNSPKALIQTWHLLFLKLPITACI